jgi:hypothetical protein
VGLRAGRRRVKFYWERVYLNTIQEDYVFVREAEYNPESGDHEPTRERHMTLRGPEPRLWVAPEEPDLYLTTAQLVEWHIRRILEPDEPTATYKIARPHV